MTCSTGAYRCEHIASNKMTGSGTPNNQSRMPRPIGESSFLGWADCSAHATPNMSAFELNPCQGFLTIAARAEAHARV